MIVDLLLNVLASILSFLLSPLAIVNFAVDSASSISVVSGFIKVIAYLFPWGNLLPLIIFTIVILNIKSIISFIRTLWGLIPFV